MNSPLITIVTVAYNAAAEIEFTMRSVLEQTYDNLEYLIIDGASRDNTIQIVRNVAKDYPNRATKIISEPDKGIYDAMNKGIQRANGAWIAFMNSGDSYYSQTIIADIFSDITTESNLRCLYGDTVFLYDDGKFICKHSKSPNNIVHNLMACHQSCFYYVEKSDRLYYDISISLSADYELTCQYYKKYGISSFCYKPIVVANYKAYDGFSSNKDSLRKSEFEKIVIKIKYGFYTYKLFKQIIRYIIHFDEIKRH